MKIYTDLVKNMKFSYPIDSELRKHSQEYRVLATLRYLFPGKYEDMTVEDSPDLQDSINDIGIEVTIADPDNDMKAADAFSKICEGRNDQEEVNKGRIESSGYSLRPTPWGKKTISATGTSDGEKKIFQERIRKKRAKLQCYREKFKVLGLALLLTEIPTSEAENCFVDWCHEVFQEDNNFFDFVYIISNRFCIYYEAQKNYSQKQEISSEEDCLLKTIAIMTAEGKLDLKDQEWQ